MVGVAVAVVVAAADRRPVVAAVALADQSTACPSYNVVQT